jgi:hypothetical protein
MAAGLTDRRVSTRRYHQENMLRIRQTEAMTKLKQQARMAKTR